MRNGWGQPSWHESRSGDGLIDGAVAGATTAGSRLSRRRSSHRSSCWSSSASSSSGWCSRTSSPITSAVRAGARIAVAEPRTATFATDAAAQVAREGSALDMTDVQALWVYQADTSGHPVGAGGTFDSCATNCVVVLVERLAFVQTGGSWDPTSQNACQGTQDSVGVYLSFRHPGVTQIVLRPRSACRATP